jgi:transposase
LQFIAQLLGVHLFGSVFKIFERSSVGPRSMAKVATAIQAMRGVGLINAVMIVPDVGDFSRFDNPRQLMRNLSTG